MSLQFTKFIKIFLIVALPILSICQENSITSLPQTEDSLVTQNDLDEDYNLLMIGLSYLNNNIKYKGYASENLPSMISDVSFIHKTGFWSAANYMKYIDASKNTFETELQLGFQKLIKEKVDIDFYYGWHSFNGDTSYEGMVYDHTLNLTTGLFLGSFSISADNYLMLGQSNNFFFDLSLSKLFEIAPLITSNDLLTISPTLTVSFGEDHWLYESMTRGEKVSTINNLQREGYKTEGFSYSGFDIFVPVIYTIGDFSFIFSWLYNIPSDKYKFLEWSNQSGYMISLIYSPSL